MNQNLYTGIINSTSFTQKQKDTVSALYTRMGINCPINETILSDMRTMLDLMRKEDDIFDEQALDKIQEIMKSSGQFSSYLVECFDKSWDKILSAYKSSYEKPKGELLKKIQSNQFDFPKDSINEESESLRKLSSFWLKDFRPTLLKDLRQKFSACLLGESMHINADFVLKALPSFNPSKLNESKDNWTALDRANQAINNISPFTTLNKISNIETNNAGLSKFYELSQELGGPQSCKIKCLGAVGAKLRNGRTAPSYDQVIQVMPILRFMPGNKSIIEAFDMVALMISVLELVQEMEAQ